jgi:uroporphyrinogen-III synthase
MTILITRPEEDARPLAVLLAGLGYGTLTEPLLDVSFERAAGTRLPPHKGILLTSANGARALALAEPDMNLPVFTVGDATARQARELGFTRVFSADGDVWALADLVRRSWKPEDGALLHVAGKMLAGDLAGMLEKDGYATSRLHMYDVRTPEHLSDTVRAAFVRDGIDAVLLFSPRTAGTFTRLCGEAGLNRHMQACRAICLSSAVRERIASLPWAGMHVAKAPTQDSLIDLLKTVCPPGQAGP